MSSRIKTPSRRMTLGGAPSGNSNGNGRMSMDVANNANAPGGHQMNEAPGSTSKPRMPRGRKSMIPRVGRENLVPPSPAASRDRATATTAASRRRSVGGPGVGGAGVGGSRGGGGGGDSAGQRRQSLVPPTAQKADPRPINEKKYQQDCIKHLLLFLAKHNYEYPVTQKTLARPSGKDFSNIVTFMLRLIDPGFQDGTLKLEDEISMNFKAMGYPYPISKTALVAAGSPHTWPSLLAALTWLMEHFQCLQVASDEDDMDGGHKPFESLQELEQQTDKAFFSYMGKAYSAFLKGEVAKQEQLETDLAERFERDDNCLEHEVERVTDLNATIVEKISHLQEESQDLPTYAKKREDYATDLETFHDLIRQMDEHKTQLAQKVKERTVELADTERKLHKMNAYVEDLKKTVDGQDLSVDDIRRMGNEQKGVNEALDRVLANKEQRRKALLKSEEELTSLCNQLDSVMADYNAKIEELALVPELAPKFAKSKATFQKNNMLDPDQSKLLGVDIQSSVRPTVLQSKTEYVEKGDQVRWEYQDALDKLDTAQEVCNEAAAKLDIVKHKNGKCEETLESEREAQDAKLAVRRREVEAMEDKVAALRDPVALEEQMAGYERQCAELEALHFKHKEDNVAQKRAVQDEMEEAFRLMSEHDEHCRRKLSDLDKYWLQKKAKMGQVQVPANIGLKD